jgi:hypothetical protein
MLGGWDSDGSRLNRPELTDYLDADGGIVLPDGANVVTFLDRHIADIGDAVAYRDLDYSQHADGKMIELTWAELGTRLRAIGARLQQITSKGDRVAILAPQGCNRSSMTSGRRYPAGTACHWPMCCWWRPASSREPPAASWLVRRAAPNISAANWAYAAIPDRSRTNQSACGLATSAACTDERWWRRRGITARSR